MSYANRKKFLSLIALVTIGVACGKTPRRPVLDISAIEEATPVPSTPDDDAPSHDNSDVLEKRQSEIQNLSQADSRVVPFVDRDTDAIGGKEFLRETQDLSLADKELAIVREFEKGNVPGFMRQLETIEISATAADGALHTAILWVTRDYLTLGGDDDHTRMPMTPMTAQKIADRLGFSLPTRKIVNRIYQHAAQKLAPRAPKAGPGMTTNAYFLKHELLVEEQLPNGVGDTGIVAGHKKDVILSQRLLYRPKKVAIYGWHKLDGNPIQPLSTVHDRTYVDYSHGIRLVAQAMLVDGNPTTLAEVMKDPVLSILVSDEGKMSVTEFPK